MMFWRNKAVKQRITVLILFFAGFAVISGAAPVYEKKASWPDTMAASRRVFLNRRGSDGFTPVSTALCRGGMEAEKITADITGLRGLCLKADTGPDNNNYDQAIWGNPVLIAADGTETPLTKLKPVSVNVGWGNLLASRNHQNKPLQVGERIFDRGFWAHAPSEIRFRLGGKYVRFEAWAGIDQAAGKNGSAVFHVLEDNTALIDLWRRMQHDFPEECAWLAEHTGGKNLDWFRHGAGSLPLGEVTAELVSQSGGPEETALLAEYRTKSLPDDDRRWLALFADAARRKARVDEARRRLDRVNLPALRRAIDDLRRTFPEKYPDGAAYREELVRYEKEYNGLRAMIQTEPEKAMAQAEALLAFKRKALLANPLIDFDQILFIRRSEKSPALGLPANWQGNCSLPAGVYNNDIAILGPDEKGRAFSRIESLYRPDTRKFAGDLDLHFDGGRFLFSMPGSHGRFQIWEIGIDGNGLRQVTAGEEQDVDNYDACYLPDGRIIYDSTLCYLGIPCVFGGSHVANLCIMNADGSGIRQLCFDQDHNWCPEVLHNGRVLYQRWEYADLPHSNTRLLFHMNPDGTAQMEYYGSNAYWPNSFFHARPVPGHPTMVAGIVTGHHGVRRMGELVLLDPARGRHEANGVVQRIPGWDEKVDPVIKDQLVNDSWPRFLHPYPLNEKYLLVSAKPTPESRWGIYLVDIFDNMLLLKEEPGFVLFEPVPIVPRPKPPVIPDRIQPGEKEALVYMADVYVGDGLKDVPHGTVKALRVLSYTFSYRSMGGLLGTIGMDGPWDVKRILGTVPVAEDGSALFRVPANTPIAVQPLDQEGKALQLMRSWFTAMPGETLSCVGCHEKQSTPPPLRPALAARRKPDTIENWYGPPRGFSFAREVQPVLDRYCVSCHNGPEKNDGNGVHASACITEPPMDLRGTEKITDWISRISGHGSPEYAGKFSVAYANLHRYVRRPGIESDYHLLTPLEFHADTTLLMQLLNRGHYGVELDEEARDRIVTWIDLNTPYHGSWTDILGEERVKPIADRKRELMRKYAGIDIDYEKLPPIPEPPASLARKAPAEKPASPGAPKNEAADWSLKPIEARQRQRALKTFERSIELGDGVALELVRIPAGAFLPRATENPVQIENDFWIARCEITNRQYAQCDPDHDSRVESKHGYQFGIHGFPLNQPEQPVVRVSHEEAMAFCEWLTDKTGMAFSLPTENQWEYACRAGGNTAFFFGDLDADFSEYANMADETLAKIATNPYTVFEEIKNPNCYDDWIPRNHEYTDGALLSTAVGNYKPNAWGLHDMHGNVWEWTRDTDGTGNAIARGGSWYDHPKRCTASCRLPYRTWQKVYNTGFRVVSTGQPPAPGRLAEQH
jgi:formylglycine-generating enzyme required for sulfatase activity